MKKKLLRCIHNKNIGCTCYVRHNSAFTLAEVLITLAVIGIVAAITLPGLIAKHNEKETVVRLKKAYSTLSNAYIGVIEEYGEPDQWDYSDNTWDNVIEKFAKHMRNVKTCKTRKLPTDKACFADVYRLDLLNNTVDTITSPSLILPDGVIIGIGSQLNPGTVGFNDYFLFIVDVNGNKKPNQWGVDTFMFSAKKGKVIPRGVKETHGSNIMCTPERNTTTPGWWNGSGCTAWVIQEGNMDYLKCVKGDQKYCNKKYYYD